MTKNTPIFIPLFWILPVLLLSSFVQGQNRWKDFDFDSVQANTTIQTPPTCLNESPTLSHKSLGPFKPGQSLRELESICDSLLYEWGLGSEAIEFPYVAILIEDTRVHFEMSSTSSMSTIVYIKILGPSIKTKEGFGITSNIHDVIKKWGSPSFGHNECQLYSWFESHPGISFALRTPANFGCMEMSKLEQTGDVHLLPQNTSIYSIHLYQKN